MRYPAHLCIACNDCAIPCKGGGNRWCAKRNPEPCIIAGILDTYGGLRVIVTPRRSLRHHKRHDELAIIVPKLIVHEPIAWNDIPIVIRRVEIEIDKWIAQRGIPNDSVQRECVVMYQLRCKELQRNSRHLPDLVYT